MIISEIESLVKTLNYAGHNSIPLQENSKLPVGAWKEHTEKKQTSYDVQNLYKGHTGNIGLITGSISNNLVVLDCDTEESFSYIRSLFPDTYSVKSKRGGHVYTKTKVPIYSTHIKTNYGKVEVRSEGCYVLAEGSVVDSHTYYKISETSKIQCYRLKTFNQILEYGFKPYFKSPEKRIQLTGSYTSPSERDMGILTTMFRQKKSLTDAIEFMKVDEKTKYQRLLNENKEKAYKYIEKSYDKLKNLKHKESYLNTKEKASRMIEDLIMDSFTGKEGIGLHRALMAHLKTSENCGKDEYHLATRSGAEVAALSYQYFHKMTHRLMDMEIIKCVKVSNGRGGNTYTIDENQFYSYISKRETNTTVTHNNVTECSTIDLGLFERGNLSASSGMIFDYLSITGRSTLKELIEGTKRSDMTVRRSLKKMMDVGIIEKKDKYYSISDVNLEEISLANGFMEKPVARKCKHKIQREEYAALIRDRQCKGKI